MPAETIRLVVALRLDESLAALVHHHKRRMLAAAGPQLYLTDPPHVTLYVAEFAPGLTAAALRRTEHLAGTIPTPAIAAGGWHVFENDPLTGRHTLVMRLSDDTCQRLRRLQLHVLSGLVPLHDTAATLSALAGRLPLLTAEQQRRATLFGFPYIGAGWIPHLTIASVNPGQWRHVEQVFNLPGEVENLSCGQFTALEVFRLQGLEPQPLASFPLAPRHIGKAA